MKKLSMLIIGVLILSGCVRSQLKSVEQPINTPLSTGIGGTIFRLNKTGDLPNAFGGRDVFGGKVDKGYAELKLVGISGNVLTLESTDVSKTSTESTMTRYADNALVSASVQNNIQIGSNSGGQRFDFDLGKQKEFVLAGVKVTFIKATAYSVDYTIQDLQKGR